MDYVNISTVHFRTDDEPIDFVEILEDPEADLSGINPLPSTHSFIDFLRRRALDDSVYVRKNALQVRYMIHCIYHTPPHIMFKKSITN